MHRVVPFSVFLILMACTPVQARPSETARPAPSASQMSATVAALPTAMATLPATATLLSAVRPPQQIINSPNGQYVAELQNFDSISPNEPPVISILNRHHSVLWNIPYQGDVTTSPHAFPWIYQWSKDSRFLYFSYKWGPDGGDIVIWWTGYHLQSIDVTTGQTEDVIPGEGPTSFAFSPDGMTLAYMRGMDEGIIHLRDMITGAEREAHVMDMSQDYFTVGDIFWAPNGSDLAFQSQRKDFFVQTWYLDTKRLRHKMVGEYKVFDQWFEGWTTENQLRFYQYTTVIAIDPVTGQTVPIGTPTPTP